MKVVLALLVVVMCLSCRDDHPATVREEQVSDETPLFASSGTKSRAQLLQKNEDGSFLINIEPHIWVSEPGCTMIVTEHGITSQLYYLLSFTLENTDYYTIWDVQYGRTHNVTLERGKEYRFLVRPLRESRGDDKGIPVMVLRVWSGEKLILDRTEEGTRE
jgi:hypothetical protein